MKSIFYADVHEKLEYEMDVDEHKEVSLADRIEVLLARYANFTGLTHAHAEWCFPTVGACLRRASDFGEDVVVILQFDLSEDEMHKILTNHSLGRVANNRMIFYYDKDRWKEFTLTSFL